MNVWLDLGIVALLALFGYSGFKRGAVYMGINAGGTVLALLTASLISSGLGLFFYNMFFHQNVVNGLAEATQSISMSDPAQAAAQTLESASFFVKNVLRFAGIDASALAVHLEASPTGIADTVEQLVRPVAVRMVSTVLAIIIFLGLMILVAFLANRFSKDIDRTKLNVANRLLGAGLGILEAVMIAVTLSMILYFVMMFISPDACVGLQQDIDKTVLYGLLRKISFPDMIIHAITGG